MLQINSVNLGDCLELMKEIPDKSVSLIISDPPWSVTDLDFDRAGFKFKSMIMEFKRILKYNGWFFLFAPFELAAACLDLGWHRKFEYVWVKDQAIPITNDTVRPMYQHEMIYAFIHTSLKTPSTLTFNKDSLITLGHQSYTRKRHHEKQTEYNNKQRIKFMNLEDSEFVSHNNGTRSPKSVLFFPNKQTMTKSERTIHPTQKPLGLVKTLVSGYSNENDLILDCCAGSGTTAIACINTNRNYICIEKEQKYFDIMKDRISKAAKPLESFN